MPPQTGPGVPPTGPSGGASTLLAQREEVSDQRLSAACDQALLRIGNRRAVDGLITEFAPAGLRTLPQERRGEFLARLQKLQGHNQP